MIVKYDEEPYDVEVCLYRVDPNDTTKFLPEPFYLNIDYVSRMVVGNDLLLPVPFIQIEYIDKGNLGVEKYPGDGRSIVFLVMKNVHLGTAYLAHFFVLDDIKVVEKRAGENLLKISGRSIVFPILQSFVEHSSGEDTASKWVEATRIAKDVLDEVKFPLDRTGQETDKRIHYATPANMTVLQVVNDLLEYAISETKGMFYLVFNMVESKGMVLSLKQLFETFDPMSVPNAELPARNIFSLPSNDGMLTQYTLANSFVATNHVQGSSMYNVVADSMRNNFSYLDRTWTQEPFSHEKHLKILPSLPRKIMDDHQPLPQGIPRLVGDKLKFREELPNLEYDRIYNKQFMMLTQMENIQFNAFTHMLRDVGQLMMVYAFSPNDAQRFGGFWMISRIYHVFTRGSAISNITAVRTMKAEGPLGGNNAA